MRESAGRNKGREEGDVRTIRQGRGNGCCGLELLIRLYWWRTIVFYGEREFCTIVFFREQRASGRLCFSVSREPLDGCVLL
jgi:hypothetical protein